jgi:RNA polymerase sigma-70 factor (ECF subfamily)
VSISSTSPAADEGSLLEVALRGDEDAFGSIVEPYRRELLVHCYRMLGSFHDAEDALQDALLRAWRGLPGFRGARLVRPWLYRIATNVCLDAIARKSRRLLPVECGPPSEPGGQPGEPLSSSIWLEPFPDRLVKLEDGPAAPEARYEQREAVELAFIAALQHLPARQRAVLIMREVLGFSAKEVAGLLDTTPSSVNSALQRARQTVDQRLPEESQQANARSLGDERLRSIVQRFLDACENGEIEAIVDLLAEDATFAMPPYSQWYRGRDALSDSWLMPGAPPTGLRYLRTSANGQQALGAYGLDQAKDAYLPIALDVLALKGERITAITAFRTPKIFADFSLPDSLPR